MRSKFKEKDINILRTYYVFDEIINIKNLDSNKIEIDEKSNKNILTYYIGYVAVKNLSYIKINSVTLYTLLPIKQIGTLKKVMETNIWLAKKV